MNSVTCPFSSHCSQVHHVFVGHSRLVHPIAGHLSDKDVMAHHGPSETAQEDLGGRSSPTKSNKNEKKLWKEQRQTDKPLPEGVSTGCSILGPNWWQVSSELLL